MSDDVHPSRLEGVQRKRESARASRPQPINTAIGKPGGLFSKCLAKINERAEQIAREQGDEAAMNWRRAERARHDSGRGSVLDEVEK